MTVQLTRMDSEKVVSLNWITKNWNAEKLRKKNEPESES